MLLLLLVSIQVKIPLMEVYESKLNLVSSRNNGKIESHLSPAEEDILCNHCKRTASNGIRCLGICVADSDY